MPSGQGRRLAAVAAAFLLLTTLSPPATLAATTQKLTGKVLAADGVSPVAGAVVTFTERASGTTYTSEPADQDGTYRVAGLPDGDYVLSITTGSGVFELPKEVTIRGGQPTTLTVILAGEPTVEAGAGVAEPEKKKRRRMVAIMLSAVGGAVIIGLTSAGRDRGDEEGSPHKP